LVHTPELLVLDEPFAGLDPVAVRTLAQVLRCVVEDRVVAHQKLHSAARRRVGVVDGAVVASERAEPKQLREVADEIGARRAGVVRGDGRQLLGHRLDPLARLPFAAREAEVEVEVGARGGDPGKTPAHAAL
jgi:ABC-type multidrug transport system ATPase subunit